MLEGEEGVERVNFDKLLRALTLDRLDLSFSLLGVLEDLGEEELVSIDFLRVGLGTHLHACKLLKLVIQNDEHRLNG